MYLYFFNLIFCSMPSAAFSEVLTQATHLNVPDVSSSRSDVKDSVRLRSRSVPTHPLPVVHWSQAEHLRKLSDCQRHHVALKTVNVYSLVL